MLECDKWTKNTCNRTCRKVSNISMIQSLNFEMISAEKHYRVKTELQRKKYGFVNLCNIAYLNKNNRTFKSNLKPYVVKCWKIS